MHECLKLTNLPGADNLSLGITSDADIFVRGDLVQHETGATNHGNSEDSNDGVSTRVTKPVLLEICTDHIALGAGLHSSAGTGFEEEEKRLE